MFVTTIRTEDELVKFLQDRLGANYQGASKEAVFRTGLDERYVTYCFTKDDNIVDNYVNCPWTSVSKEPMVLILNTYEKGKLSITRCDLRPDTEKETISIDYNLTDTIVSFRRFNTLLHIPQDADRELKETIATYAMANIYI